MKPYSFRMLIGLLLLLASLAVVPPRQAAAAGAEPGVETFSGSPPSVPVGTTAVLDANGYRLHSAEGALLAQLWFRKDIPVSGSKQVEGANYPTLNSGLLIGVISFPARAKDFRGQTIKPGTYALRYALLPSDGNHMGVAPGRDFVLLVNIANDPGPAKVLPYGELVKLSSQVAGTNHPAVFSMPASDSRPLPAAYVDENGYLVFAAKLNTTSGDLPIALIVKGVSM